MQNANENYERFLNSLTKMGELFSDAMSEARQTLYWELLAPILSLEEWEYACAQAMTCEDFHKVPLPATLMTYVKEYRMQQREAMLQQQRMAEEERRALTETQRRALAADPAWRAEQDQCFREAMDSLNTVFGTDWRERTDMQRQFEVWNRDQRIRRELSREEDATPHSTEPEKSC